MSHLTYETSISMPIPPIWPKNSTAVTSEPSLDHTEPLEKGHNNLLAKSDFRAWLQSSTKTGLRISPFTRSLHHRNERFYEVDALPNPPTKGCNSTLSLSMVFFVWNTCLGLRCVHKHFSKMLSWTVGNSLCHCYGQAWKSNDRSHIKILI